MAKNISKTIIIGGMRFLTANACAHRSLCFADLASDVSDEVLLLGLDKEATTGSFHGYPFITRKYPASLPQWISHTFSAKGIIKILKQQHFDNDKPSLVIVNGSVPSVPTKKIARFCKKKHILFVLDVDEWYAKSTDRFPRNIVKDFDTNYRMNRLCHQYKDYVVASSFVKNHCGQDKNILTMPTFIYQKVPFEPIPYSSGEGNAIRLCFVGMIEKHGTKENLDEVIKAIRVCNAEEGPKYVLDIVGTGGDDETYIHYHGVQPYEKAIGFVARADFSLIPRKGTRKNNAGFPTKLSESFLYGVPSIATKTSDVADYIVDGENGFLATDDTEEVYCDIFRKIKNACVQDPDYLNRIKKSTLRNNKLTIETFRGDFVTFVDRLLEK